MEKTRITLQELACRIGAAIAADSGTQNVWVTAEIQNLNPKPQGYCFMRLVQKDETGTRQLTAMEAVCWSNVWPLLQRKFFDGTGQRLTNDLKVMLKVSAQFNDYGFRLIVSDIDPAYTMGDLLRRRREIVERLTREGVIEMNRSLSWPIPVQRIAIISAQSAAGFGDFMHQLIDNDARLRFAVKLFPAAMQGNSAPAGIIAALGEISDQADRWDAVAIIRGGGATSDLHAFENYDLAAAIAQFPLPVAIGIGHTRDTTVLDFVAKAPLKTPTAVADFFLDRGKKLLQFLNDKSAMVCQLATDRMAADKEMLTRLETRLPDAALGLLARSDRALTAAAAALTNMSATRITPARSQLDMMQARLTSATADLIRRRLDRLQSLAEMIALLSPAATLARGYSITRVDGHAVSSPDQVPPGAELEITLAGGTVAATAR